MTESLAAAPDLLESTSSIVQLALGALLLLFGRRLFWLLIGVVGFLGGLLLTDAFLSFDSEATRWIIGLLAGVAAALLAIALQRLAVSVAGALIAGYSTHWYLALGGEPLQTWHWVLIAVAAVAGLLVARSVFDLGLIILSCLAGATLVVENLGGGPTTSRWLFLVLLLLGGAFQAWSLSRKSD